MQDYAAQLDFWAEIPPPNISLALIASAHGANFGGLGHKSSPAQSGPLKEPDPFALQALLGQAEPIPYRAPKKGLLLN